MSEHRFSIGDRVVVTGNHSHYWPVGTEGVIEGASGLGNPSYLVRRTSDNDFPPTQYVLAGELAPAVGAVDHGATLHDVITRWREQAERLTFQGEEYDDAEEECDDALADQLRQCATQVEVALGIVDTASSASRQHFIETGRYLRHGEEV